MDATIAGASTVPLKTTKQRIESIDLLRGLVMIIMALDHVRDYFHADAFVYDPTDLSKTSAVLFFTRWITHFCAPTFMFLSGTSAYLVGVRKGKKYLAKFLITRGLWLIFLEMTVVNFAWFFNPSFPVIDFIVIWALGLSMLILAALIYLPLTTLAILSLIIVFGHNLLDGINISGDGPSAYLWSFLHKQNIFFETDHIYFIGYPIIPWFAVMALGYCLGKFYTADYDAEKRKKILKRTGAGATALFIVLRFTNVYGDPSQWSAQSSPAFTFLSFLKVSKYPPSLLYLLVTIGPGLLLLAYTENARSWVAQQLKLIGRVPMFYYILHIYLLHLIALFATYLCGLTWKSMVLDTWVSFDPNLKGYGFSLGVTYLVWISVILLLYFPCKWYDRYKKSHPEKWWLSYL